MKKGAGIQQIIILTGLLFFFSGIVTAEKSAAHPIITRKPALVAPQTDSLSRMHRFMHSIGGEIRPLYVFPTNPFVEGINYKKSAINNAFAFHLKYSFQAQPGTPADQLYGGAYQGIGLGYYSFGNRKELGNPLTFYLLQGARIARFSSRLSFNYEWNFGLSLGWKPYDPGNNRFNIMIGSKMNAYINTNFYLNWSLSPYWTLTPGITLTHFSNGNTRLPNAGMNITGLKVGLVYHFNQNAHSFRDRINPVSLPPFPRHVSYDLVIFGSWRRKGYFQDGEYVPSPDTYKVVGFSFAPMYNIGYKFRTGVALDGVYDSSSNVFVLPAPGQPRGFVDPPFNAQIALGLSGRVEFVMPYFTVGIGMGYNVIHRGGDLRTSYQMLTLKISMTRSSFLHIGYNLREFSDPNFLMLGIGFRFNNKYPSIYR